MDCENFDLHLMDALYDELDDMTREAMRQHAEGCTRCASAEGSLRATVEVAQLPLEEPPPELEQRVLAAAHATQREAPWYRKLVQTVAWAGSHAMRPQLAMAALLVLVLGSSVLLLRARPGSVSITPVRVTEKGAPSLPGAAAAAEGTAVAGADDSLLEAREAPRQAGAAEEGAEPQARGTGEGAEPLPADQYVADGTTAGDNRNVDPSDETERFERGLSNYRAGRMQQARSDFAEVARMGGGKAASASLYEARAVRSAEGCAAAIPLYEQVRRSHAGGPAAADAAWEQADCHRIQGQLAAAEQLWRELESSPTYGRRAANELADRGQVATASKQTAGGASGGKASPPRAAPPTAEPTPNAAPSAQQNQTP